MIKKAQAAMEFLMTYGWAVLVVVAAIAAMSYFGVLSTNKFLPFSCNFPAGTACIDKPVIDAENDRINLALKNNLGYDINMTGFVNITQGCSSPEIISINNMAPPVIVNNDENIIVSVLCPGLEKGRSKTEIRLKYRNYNTALDHVVVGHITGVAS
ncbi:hypothetical protein GF327_07405 [Candidatus Woesearchaeota archaeon]|nr:hypothetical protein [Candidatus Woesearchaeota archaeon]